MKGTIVSMLPWKLVEPRPSLIPAEFTIQPGSDSDPEVTVIDDAVGLMYIDGDRGNMRVPKSGFELAQSIVNDYVNSLMCIGDTCKPGIFVLEGVVSKADLKAKHKQAVDNARSMHRNWLLELIKMADGDWVKYGKKPQLVTDVQRFACKSLGFEREWMVTLDDAKTIRCPMCQSLVSELAAVCAQCGCVLNPEKAKQFQVITR